MVVEYLASYDRSFRRLPRTTQAHTIRAIDRLLDYFVTGQRPHGLGLKRLHKDYWEVRVGLGVRIMFELRGERLTFVVVGSHEAIRRWLKAA
jgi:mRNA-degrading endonuclease RelE of RelBE toxin-antitoxin system